MTTAIMNAEIAVTTSVARVARETARRRGAGCGTNRKCESVPRLGRGAGALLDAGKS